MTSDAICIADKKPGKVAIVTGGGTGHLPLFLGYVGENLLDGCGVGSVSSHLQQSRYMRYQRKWKPEAEYSIFTEIIQGI